MYGKAIVSGEYAPEMAVVTRYPWRMSFSMGMYIHAVLEDMCLMVERGVCVLWSIKGNLEGAKSWKGATIYATRD